ncbi:hypothetical protein GCM10027035_02770 [Emticicia sediminis]
MKKIILFFLLLPILVNAQINLSNSSFSVNNGSCSGASISVNGNYLLDEKVNSRYQFSQTLNLQAPNYQLCFNNTVYSVPSNKLSMRWSGSQWQLGFVGTANNQTNFIEISSIPFGSIYSINHTPGCDAPIFGGVLKGMPTITGPNCVGSTLTASAFGATAFQWYKDLNAISGATNATYTPTEPGNYQVATTFEEGFWRPTLASPATQQLIDVFFINSTTGWVLGSGGQIFKTTSAGDTWMQQTSGVTTNLNAIHFTDVSEGVAVGANGVIVRTINGGTTWQAVSSGVSNNLTDVFFLNANTGWAVGSQYVVLKTIDGGATWNTISIDNGASTSDSYNDVQFTDINTGYVAGSSSTNSTSFVRKSIDGGTNWATSTSTSVGVIRRLSFIDNNTGWTGGRSSNPNVTLPEVSKTANGGTNWLSYSGIQTNTYANTAIASLQFIDANRGWMVSSSSTNTIIISTVNGGSTFFAGPIYFNQQNQYIGSKIFMLPDGSRGWIIGRDFANNKNILTYSNSICSSYSYTVNGSAAPTLSQTGTVSLCPGASITLQASGCNGTLRWSTGATTSSISIQNAGTYSATCETTCGISPTSEILTIQAIAANQNLSGNATTSTQRAGTITSTQRVAAGTTSTYSATQSVTLSPAFQADNGSVFSAKIEGCN